MPSVDNRVVSMTFDNSAFENRISETMKSLDSLNDTIAKVGTNQNFDQVNAAAQRFDTSHMSSALDNISSKFSALGAVGFSVINNLTTGMFDMATHILQLGKQDILAPIITGGKERAMNIEQAKFMFEGMGINVDKAMASAKSAVLGTAYGLDAAAKVAAQFGASGIAAGDQMTGALRGVAGAAAMTGSSFAEIGDIFAQSAALGHVNTMDLQQFSTRGLNAAAAIAPILHKTEAQVREMASSGELDFKTFADAMDKAFGKHATEANKTFAGSLANVHAAMSRLGEAFFATQLTQQRDVFNALSPAIDKLTTALKPLFAAFNDISKVVTDKLIDRIKGFNFGPITDAIPFFISGLKNIFAAVQSLEGIIHSAFRDIFPKDTVPTIVRISILFNEFTSHLKPSAEGAERLRTVFKGLFSIVEIGWHVIMDVAQLLLHLYHDIFPANEGGVLKFAASFAELLVKLDNFLITEGRLDAFFAKLNKGIAAAVAWVKELEQKIIDFFDHIGAKVGNADPVSETLGRMQQRADQVSNIWDKIKAGFERIKPVLDEVWTDISNWFKELGDKIANAFHPGDFDTALDALNVGLLGGLVTLLHRFFEGKSKIDISFGGKMMAKINGMIGNLKATLKVMQTEIKAKAILEIAAAVGIIAASLTILSLIDSKKLSQALGAITVAFIQLTATLKFLDDLGGGDKAASSAKIATLALSMDLIAGSLVILAGAIAILSAIDPLKLASGLLAMTAGLAVMIGAAKVLGDPKFGESFVGVAASMILMSTALVILATAMKIFATMSWEEIGKGLVATAGGLLLIGLAMNFMPASSVLSGIGLIAFAVGLAILAGVMKILATISWEGIGKGLLALAGILLIITVAVNNIPVLNMLAVGFGLMSMAKGIAIIAAVVIALSLLKIETLAKGLGALAAMLLILVVAVNTMQSALLGAVSMIIIAGALTMLTAVLVVLGNLSIAQIVTGLLAIVGVFVVIGGAAILLQSAVPAILLLGIALGTVGAAMALFGGGIYLLGKGLQMLAEGGLAGAKTFATMIPQILGAVLKGALDQVEDLIKAVPLLVRLLEAILDQLATTIIKLAPKIAKALIALFKNGLLALREIYPDLIQTGLFLLLKLLEGIANNIGPIVEAATNIIINFIEALAQQLPLIIQAGVDLITAWLLGIAGAVDQIIGAVIFVIATFITELGNHVDELIQAGANLLITLISGIASAVLQIADAVTNIIQTFIIQMGIHAIEIANTGTAMLITFLTALTGDVIAIANAISGLIISLIGALGNDAGQIAAAGAGALAKFLKGLGGDANIIGQAISTLIHDIVTAMVNTLDNVPAELQRLADSFIRFLNGLADVIRKEGKPLGDAMANLANAMIDGFGDAFAEGITNVIIKRLPGPLQGFAGAVRDFFKGSPVERGVIYKIGQRVMVGFGDAIAQGFDNSTGIVTLGANSMANALMNASDILGNTAEFNPTITPVLDLTQVQLEATKIDGLMKISALTPNASFSVAGDISAQQALIDAAKAQTDQNLIPTKDLNFNQTINAPEPLTANDIYRNTKSQIALAKEELGL